MSRRRVLIIGPSNIGDALLASDVIAAVSRAFPTAHCNLVVGERAKTLFVGDPRIHSLVDADQFSAPLARLKLTWALWSYHPHVVVDLRHTLYPLLLKPLSAWRYLRQPPKRLAHMRDRHLWKLRAQVPRAAASVMPREVSAPTHHGNGGPLWISKADASHVDALWRRWQLDPARPLVIIAPGARGHTKRWTSAGFARVAQRLIAERRAQVIFSGEPDEDSVVEEIQHLMTHRAPSAVGLTTMRQLGILMQRAALAITNDSAALHLASTWQIPTLAVFGPTDARKYGPTSPVNRTIRRALFCAPCERALCRFNHECMRFVSPDEVYQAAIELLEVGSRKLEAGIQSQKLEVRSWKLEKSNE